MKSNETILGEELAKLSRACRFAKVDRDDVAQEMRLRWLTRPVDEALHGERRRMIIRRDCLDVLRSLGVYSRQQGSGKERVRGALSIGDWDFVSHARQRDVFLERQVLKLPPAQQRAIVAIYWTGEESHITAERYGVSPASVRQAREDGRKTLRRLCGLAA